MSKKLILAFVGLVGIAGLFIFIFTNPLNTREAAIKLVSQPSAQVIINSKPAGSTPYENDSLPAELTTIRLEPENIDMFWQRDLDLTPNAQTIVDWSFNPETNQQSGSVLYLEEISYPKQADLMVTCQPQSCSVKLDGQLKGPAPINLEDVAPGEHTIMVSQPGYKAQEVVARTVEGYRLVVEMQLAKTDFEQPIVEDDQPEPTPGPDLEEVIIQDTPTGWLRVREGPSTGNAEVAKVYPEEKYVLLDEQNGWYKIEYEEAEEGWISGDYAQKAD